MEVVGHAVSEPANDRNWRNILRLPDPDRHRALAILRWAAFALRPLTTLEMMEALSVMNDNDSNKCGVNGLPGEVDQDHIDREILRLCGSLVEVGAADPDQAPGSKTVYLTHSSAKEYLCSQPPDSNQSTAEDLLLSDQAVQNNILGLICVRYLNDRRTWECDLSHRPFLAYASKWWYQHASPSGKNYAEFISVVNNFFYPGNPNWDSWRMHFEQYSPMPRAEYISQDYANEQPGTPLYYASLFGLVETMYFLLNEASVDLDTIGGPYGTALQAACVQGHMSAVRFLIDHGANPAVVAGEFGSALHAAAHNNRESVAQFLIDNGTNIELRDSRGVTPLYHASLWGHSKIVKLLLDKDADITINNRYGWTVTNLACAGGDVETFKLLASKGADSKSPLDHGWAPIHSAAAQNHSEIAGLLIEQGVDIATADDYGRTPLRVAAGEGHTEMVKLLLDHGADLTVTDDDGGTPLNVAANRGHLEVVKLLLDRGADLEVANNDGWTPLISAADTTVVHNMGYPARSRVADHNYLEVVQFLIEKGADTTVVTESGWTALHSAASRGCPKLVKLLLDNGANVNICSRLLGTPLHLAMGSSHEECAKLLLAHGALTTTYDGHGRTPVDLAIAQRSSDSDKTKFSFIDGQATEQRLREAELRKTVQSFVIQSQKSRIKSRSIVYHLARCLVLLNDDSLASAALKQAVAPYENENERPIRISCDMCHATITETFYVCRSCPSMDLCEKCMTEYKRRQGWKGCSSHEFLGVPGGDLGSDGPDDALNASSGFVVAEWVGQIQRTYVI